MKINIGELSEILKVNGLLTARGLEDLDFNLAFDIAYRLTYTICDPHIKENHITRPSSSHVCSSARLVFLLIRRVLRSFAIVIGPLIEKSY